MEINHRVKDNGNHVTMRRIDKRFMIQQLTICVAYGYKKTCILLINNLPGRTKPLSPGSLIRLDLGRSNMRSRSYLQEDLESVQRGSHCP